MPRPRDPDLRDTLLTAAARVLAEEGPSALTVRRLTRETGASATAVYTYFGSMDDLRREIRRDGFARLQAALDAVGETGDPVADLAASAEVYFAFGLADPHRYRAMFVDRPVEDDTEGEATFRRLTRQVERGVDDGRFADPARNTDGATVDGAVSTVWAAQVWSMRHGMVTMTLSGALPADAARHVLADMLLRLAVGYGDRPERARDSVERGRGRAAPRSARPGPP